MIEFTVFYKIKINWNVGYDVEKKFHKKMPRKFGKLH